MLAFLPAMDRTGKNAHIAPQLKQPSPSGWLLTSWTSNNYTSDYIVAKTFPKLELKGFLANNIQHDISFKNCKIWLHKALIAKSLMSCCQNSMSPKTRIKLSE